MESLEEQIAPLFFMQPSQEENDSFVAQMLEFAKEKLLHAVRIVRRGGSAVVQDLLRALIQAEGLPREPALLLSGKADRARVPQHPVFRPGPIQPFLKMRERIGPLEPGVQHS